MLRILAVCVAVHFRYFEDDNKISKMDCDKMIDVIPI
jgi:hypothetical protein